MNYCEICGKKVSNTITIRIETAELKVCKACVKFGKEIFKSSKTIKKTKVSVKKPIKEIDEYELVENYGDIIRKAREEMKLSRSDLAKILKEKESVIARIENYEMIPDDKLARKLEKFFKIKLLRKIE